MAATKIERENAKMPKEIRDVLMTGPAMPKARKPWKPKPDTAVVISYVAGKKVTGAAVTLAPRVETGIGPCPGEAHKNAFIDNCMLCAPRWGEVVTYAPLTPAACAEGFAVPCHAIPMKGENWAEFKAAETAGLVEIVMVEQKSSSFNVYVATGCTAHSDCRATPELGRACLDALSTEKEGT